MTIPTVVFAGAGDLARRSIEYLHSESFLAHYVAVARSQKTFARSQFIEGDLTQPSTLNAIIACHPQVIVLTLVPNGSGEEGYRKGYLDPLIALIQQLQRAEVKPLILFASSTGVYHQELGEWVDEHSPTHPINYSGRCMLQAEQWLASSGLPFCCIRFGGIYGPGRDFLITQVQSGFGGGPEFTNRIHQNDAGRLLGFLVMRYLAGDVLPTILLACDSNPASSSEVRSFIAERLGVDKSGLQPSATSRGGNKRCLNALLVSLGFVFDFPSFRDGYKRVGEPINPAAK
jgi:nucleoside-diphosphate-sugar epimerase